MPNGFIEAEDLLPPVWWMAIPPPPVWWTAIPVWGAVDEKEEDREAARCCCCWLFPVEWVEIDLGCPPINKEEFPVEWVATLETLWDEVIAAEIVGISIPSNMGNGEAFKTVGWISMFHTRSLSLSPSLSLLVSLLWFKYARLVVGFPACARDTSLSAL